MIIMQDQGDEELIGLEVSRASIPIEEVEEATEEYQINTNMLIAVSVLFFFLGFYYGRSLWH